MFPLDPTPYLVAYGILVFVVPFLLMLFKGVRIYRIRFGSPEDDEALGRAQADFLRWRLYTGVSWVVGFFLMLGVLVFLEEHDLLINHSKGIYENSGKPIAQTAQQTSSAFAYSTVFDIESVGYREWKTPGLLVLMLVAGIFAYLRVISILGDLFFVWWFFRVWIGLAAFMLVAIFTSTFLDYRGLLSSVRTGRCELIEGKVSGFSRSTDKSRIAERFCVGTRCFEYSNIDSTAGFNTLSSNGGPIRDGAQVRLCAVGNTIGRLEVATQ